MTKQDVKQIVLAKYPELGEDRYVPKLPDISEAALARLESTIRVSAEMMGAHEYVDEIIAFIDQVKDERAKR